MLFLQLIFGKQKNRSLRSEIKKKKENKNLGPAPFFFLLMSQNYFVKWSLIDV